MSKATRIGIFVVVVCGLIGNLLALDGTGYLGFCKTYLRLQESPESATVGDGIDGGVCMGYLQGVTETARIWQQGKKFCLPEAAKNDQLIRVSIKYLEDNPAELHKPATFLLQMAFIDAFPCTEGEQ